MRLGHLGLEHMLDLMCDQFFWPCMSAQAKEHIDKPMSYLQSQGPSGKHCGHTSLDYLCLEPGKGLEENVIVVTDHFTQYTKAYVN